MVYLFMADGFEEIEGLTVVDLLRRADISIKTVSITGSLTITGAHAIKVEADTLFENEDFKDASLLVLPGGMPGTKHLLEHTGLVSLLKTFNEQEKKLAAICAAPSVLGINGILNGKKATCYPGFEDKLLGAVTTGNKVEVASNVTTSRGLGTAIDFSLEIISQLKDKKTADAIAAAILYA
ncbi:thiazole biosynthesis protein ThiJ [Anaerocolumna cellulosilytica]|uniref:Thiazole biosynthesis protein ThiJ n=1 Tax=Anaerocolumna cellulosilytica TaxID=433286 RepID=A0A6S6RCB8_9FIRM|nr:DJ-1 family glyoxalase III [Anaerocolumna cellulosilytica]MBB5197733.1 4-methyl-5(b-hydroxyethyl)-thiazole monophosphate biosynthesis [Anaerocolumna cellulosilytica]BCJ96488.1 thiazole biosynthesis protein ThiJ [Anaerocolumna cellulosilytica]